MRTIASLLFLLIANFAFAQRECATNTYILQSQAANKNVADGIAQAEYFLQQKNLQQALQIPSSAAGTSTGSASNVIRIPVVVHIIYNNASQNISDAQVKSQIDALNRDFRLQNSDAANIPSYFKSLAADVEIEFVLATADERGRATNGIVRKQTSMPDWGMDDRIKQSAKGGNDAWDSKSYLNIWVGNMRSVLGYSSVPGGDAKLDGVVISTAAFGTINTAAPYNLGRTAVHEVGHWLGLKHIWGDAACGDDLVEDTPKQGTYTTGCPSAPKSTCSNTNGDMYMNYMDFTNDACLNMFTQGQKQRMRNVFASGGPRNTILSSKGLFEPWLEEAYFPEEPKVTAVAQLQLYPNPAAGDVVLKFNSESDADWVGKEVSLLNMNGVLVQKIQLTSKMQKINVAALKPGIYFLQGNNGSQKIFEKIVKL
jgi:hypothetical protein